MKIPLIAVSVIAMLGLVIAAPPAQSGNELFAQARVKETSEGNMPEAIKLYQTMVAKYSSDPDLVARALVQMGLGYEKLGNEAEARKAFDRVLRDYKNQQESVTKANARLAALDRAQLAAVLGRAAQYVAFYEDHQLDNVGGAESYRQVSVSFSSNKVRLSDEIRLESDFLLFRHGDERRGLRIVRRVDGVAVRDGGESFEVLRDDSPEGILKGITALVQQSARYNIGDVPRTFKAPTVALSVVRHAEPPRFDFAKRGAERINGVQTWEVAFKERTDGRGPTLVLGASGESLFSEGRLWIEPTTGRILKTELQVENPYSKPKAKGRVTVIYTENKTLRMYVPSQMMERYENEDGFIEGRADYTNFWLFKK